MGGVGGLLGYYCNVWMNLKGKILDDFTPTLLLHRHDCSHVMTLSNLLHQKL